MMIGWREELKETRPEQTRARNSVYTLMHQASHFALLVATLVVFLLLSFYTVFNTIVNLNVCSLAIFRFVIKKNALFSL